MRYNLPPTKIDTFPHCSESGMGQVRMAFMRKRSYHRRPLLLLALPEPLQQSAHADLQKHNSARLLFSSTRDACFLRLMPLSQKSGKRAIRAAVERRLRTRTLKIKPWKGLYKAATCLRTAWTATAPLLYALLNRNPAYEREVFVSQRPTNPEQYSES